MTPDEADARLRQAIIDHAQAYDTAESDDLLSEYVVVASWIPTDRDDDPRTVLSVSVEGDAMPHHHIVGLLQCALHGQLSETWAEDD